MPVQTYEGSCHCGALRFQADLELAAGTNKCNCSNCSKSRAWFAFARGADRYRLLSGSEALTEYRWTPPGRSEPFLTYAFCRTCGSMGTAKTCPHGDDAHVSLSGTRVREMLQAGEEPPVEFSRPEVARILIEAARR